MNDTTKKVLKISVILLICWLVYRYIAPLLIRLSVTLLVAAAYILRIAVILAAIWFIVRIIRQRS